MIQLTIVVWRQKTGKDNTRNKLNQHRRVFLQCSPDHSRYRFLFKLLLCHYFVNRDSGFETTLKGIRIRTPRLLSFSGMAATEDVFKVALSMETPGSGGEEGQKEED